MEKKHWYYILVCSLVIVICSVLYMNYYKEYVAPKSYTIGSFKPRDYTDLEIKEQLTSEDVLFSQDFDDVTFKVDESSGIATYEFSASPIQFNGENNDYVIYVNEYLVSNLDITAGAISGTYDIKYYDVDKSVLATSTLNLSFASYTKQLLFRLTLPSEDIGLLMRYFEVNDFIVTLSVNPFSNSELKVSSYNVDFVVDDEIISSSTVVFGGYASSPNYELNGCKWSADGLNVVDISTYRILSDTTFVLVYPFTLTFDANGGMCDIEIKELYYTDIYGDLPTPVKEGYTFNGWYTSAVGGTKVNSTTTMGDSATTIHAQWSPITYTIKFDGNGATGGSMSDMVCIYDTAKALDTNAYIKDDAEFVGWATSPNGAVEYFDGDSILNLTSNTETITLYAIWTNCYYTARVYTMTTGGQYGSGYTTLIIPSLSGNVNLIEDANTSSYVIENGVVLDKITDLNGNVITSIDIAEDDSTIVKFYYKRVQHTLTLNANGGTITNATDWTVSSDNLVATKTLYYEQMYDTLPTPVREGYIFNGWYTSAIGGTEASENTTMDISDITIYAQWIEE